VNSILASATDNIGGLLPASKAEFRRVDAENAALKAQNTALSSRDDQLEKTVDSLVIQVNSLTPVSVHVCTALLQVSGWIFFC
jgi:hypothetical protein